MTGRTGGWIPAVDGYAGVMTSDDERRPGRPGRQPGEPTLFEKPGGPPEKPAGGRTRLPVGAILAIALAVVVLAGVVLFLAASCSGGGATGSTTGGTTAGLVLLLPGG